MRNVALGDRWRERGPTELARPCGGRGRRGVGSSAGNARGPVAQGEHPRPELATTHQLERDAFAQTGQ